MKSFLLAALTAGLFAILAAPFARAEEPKPPVKETPKKEGDKKEGDKKEEAKPAADDPYAIPETKDAATLVAFCKKLMSMRTKTREEQAEHVGKVRPILKTVSEKI